MSRSFFVTRWTKLNPSFLGSNGFRGSRSPRSEGAGTSVALQGPARRVRSVHPSGSPRVPPPGSAGFGRPGLASRSRRAASPSHHPRVPLSSESFFPVRSPVGTQLEWGLPRGVLCDSSLSPFRVSPRGPLLLCPHFVGLFSLHPFCQPVGSSRAGITSASSFIAVPPAAPSASGMQPTLRTDVGGE